MKLSGGYWKRAYGGYLSHYFYKTSTLCGNKSLRPAPAWDFGGSHRGVCKKCRRIADEVEAGTRKLE